MLPEKVHYTKRIRLVLVILCGVLLFFSGVYAGNKGSLWDKISTRFPVLGYHSAIAETSGSSISESQMSQFWYVWNLLEQKYPFKEKEPKDADRIYGAIAGLTASYNDPYTMFFPPVKAKLFNEDVKGEFGGVGIELGVRNGLPTVIAPLKGSPADLAGMLPGDVIVSVDDHKITEADIDKIVSWIRGTEGSKTTLSILRKGVSNPITITLTRSKINVPIIDTEIINDVFVIHFYSFSEKSAVLFNEALDNFNKSGKRKILIDMRNNPGGYLDAAVEIASNMLPAGEVVVKEDNGKDADMYLYKSRGYKKLPDNIQVGVLLNEGSASASEILAGALQDHKRATIYGTKSFGKGSVQELIPLSDGSSVKITVAKWFTPDGHSISEKGITPDVEIINQEAVPKNTKPVTTDKILDLVIQKMKKN